MTVTSVETSTHAATAWLAGWIERQLGIPADALAPSCDMRDLAMDSTESLLLLEAIRGEFGVRLRPMAFVSSSLGQLGHLIAESATATGR